MNLHTLQSKSGQSDAIYPFGCGVYQWAVNYSESIFSQFLDSDFDFSTLDEGKFRVARLLVGVK